MRGRCGGISGRCGLACYSQNYSLPLVHDLGALCFRSIANAIWTNKPPTTTLWALGALGNPTYAPHWVGLPRRNLELEQSSYFPDTPDRRSLGHIPLPPLRRTPPRTRKGSSRSSLRVAHAHISSLCSPPYRLIRSQSPLPRSLRDAVLPSCIFPEGASCTLLTPH